MLIPGKLYKNTNPDDYYVFEHDILMYLDTKEFKNRTMFCFLCEKEEISFENNNEFIEL